MAVVKLKSRTNMKMKRFIFLISALVVILAVFAGCEKDYPVDEDGLLITTRGECYVSNFELLGTDYQSVRAPNPANNNSTSAIIDTTAQTISVVVLYGTDLTRLYPQFSLVTDAKLDPKITGFMDFSDLSNPKKWTVVAGNRSIRKTYSVYVTVQPKP